MGAFVHWAFSIRVRTAAQASPICCYRRYHENVPFDATSFPAPNNESIAVQQEWNQLLYQLTKSSPSIWSTYKQLVQLIGSRKIPLAIHRQVLRKAVPPAEREGRVSVSQIKAHETLYPYENRLRVVIGNIRSTGTRPSIDDYNFVLQQFAKVGHMGGSHLVFQEMLKMRVHPNYYTYGLCLQAIAYRLSLPIGPQSRSMIHNRSISICKLLLGHMTSQGSRLTVPNFDLICRIYKQTEMFDLFHELIKIGLGIDLRSPDRLSLEAQKLLEEGKIQNVLPLTTSTLNTIIHFLGEQEKISMMVTAFEVFTNPLPPVVRSNQWTDDDDDDPAFFPFLQPGMPRYPSTEPNITTFVYLVLHAASAENRVLAKHYIKMASKVEEEQAARIQSEILIKSLEEIDRPTVRVNGIMFFYFYRMCTFTKHRASLDWARFFIRDVMQNKQKQIEFLSNWRRDQLEKLNHKLASDNSSYATELSPSSFSSVSSDQPLLNVRRSRFDLDMHLSVLKRDVQQLKVLTQKIDERLEKINVGYFRRQSKLVWDGKHIFVAGRGTTKLSRKDFVLLPPVLSLLENRLSKLAGSERIFTKGHFKAAQQQRTKTLPPSKEEE